jgi:hypothetical protein
VAVPRHLTLLQTMVPATVGPNPRAYPSQNNADERSLVGQKKWYIVYLDDSVALVSLSTNLSIRGGFAQPFSK